MTLGTVRGHIVSTINHPFYDGKKLLLEPWFVPVDHAVVGIVDERYVEEG